MSGKLEQRIQSAHLTRTEKVIADYFLEHSGSLYFLTAKDIALALGVSDTSVIRLCRTLGYRGFRELQESLRSELSQVIEREKYVIPQHQVPDKLQKYQDLSSFQCLQFAVDCLQETYRKNDPENTGRSCAFCSRVSTFLSPASAVWRGQRGTWACCCRSIPGTWSISATQTPAAWKSCSTTARTTV